MKRMKNKDIVNAVIAMNGMGNRPFPGTLSHALTWNLKELMAAYNVYEVELKKLEEKGLDINDSNVPEVKELLDIELDLNIKTVPQRATRRDDIMISVGELVSLDFMFEKPEETA